MSFRSVPLTVPAPREVKEGLFDATIAPPLMPTSPAIRPSGSSRRSCRPDPGPGLERRLVVAGTDGRRRPLSGYAAIAVYEVATFYSMFELKPVGRHSISVCTNISCMLRGGDAILAHIEKKLGIRLGESTADGKFFLKREEECLAACCGAPMMQVDHVYYEHLTPEQVDRVLDSLE
jgi:hypothetical protein